MNGRPLNILSFASHCVMPCRTEVDIDCLPGAGPVAYSENNVGHLQERPVVQLCFCPPSEVNVSASSGLAVALRCRWDRCK